ncbi:MAG: hypothetical protein IT186_13300 [Acidobacteria bacterium]|nr:hypothetical protein [Acidobacteriota bacterium]
MSKTIRLGSLFSSLVLVVLLLAPEAATAQCTGTIYGRATLNGASWSGSLTVKYNIDGGAWTQLTVNVPSTSAAVQGTFGMAYVSGGPSGAGLSTITPSASQYVSCGSSVTFTFNFVSTGTIYGKATFNNQPWNGPFTTKYRVNGGAWTQVTNTFPSTSTAVTGNWEIQYVSGGPSGYYSVTPSSTQSLSSGGSLTYTFNFRNTPAYSGGEAGYADFYAKNYPYQLGNYASKQRQIGVTKPCYWNWSDQVCMRQMCNWTVCGNQGSMPVFGGRRTDFGTSCFPLFTETVLKDHLCADIGAWKHVFCLPNFAGHQLSNGSLYCHANNLRIVDPIGGRTGSCARQCFSGCCDVEPCLGPWDIGDGPLVRRVFWGQVTPDDYGMVPSTNSTNATDIVYGFVQAFIPAGKKLASGSPGIDYGTGDVVWETAPNTIDVRDRAFGGGTGPTCGIGEIAGKCYTIAQRAKAYQFPDGHWEVMITGYLTGDNILQNTSDLYKDLSNLGGSWSSVNPTVFKVASWLNTNGLWNQAVLVGHSLGAADVATLMAMGYGSYGIALSPPYKLPDSSLKPNGRILYNYSGLYDKISNPPYNGWTLNQHRRSVGVNLTDCNTGTGNLTFNSPHDRCKYFACIGWACR